MEILNKNYIQTTTSIAVASGTLTVDYLLKRDSTFQYVSSGFNDDTTICSITFTLDSTLPMSRMALLEHNFKKFNIYYNGSTANAFTLTDQNTTTSQWLTNSETSMFLRFDTISVYSITIDAYSTQSANAEKALGYFVASDLIVDFERVPSAKNYRPVIDPEEVVHKLSDGSARLQRIDETFNVSIKYDYISKTFRDQLKAVYDLRDDFIFVAFGTSSSWDEILYPVIWTGNFDFHNYSDNAIDSGFSGSIKLTEIR